MSRVDVVAVVLLVGATFYAVLGGADFGVGFWDLVGGDARARAFAGHAIGPVWEANHVWLVFCLVVLWTGFPSAFVAVMTTLFVPLVLAALGIVMRGAAYAFRLYAPIFGVSSVLTPFFMGTVVGAVASGRVPAEGYGAPVSSWLNGTSLLVGVLFVASCAYLSAVFLIFDARREGDEELVAAFRRRALPAGAAAGVLALAGLPVLAHDARYVFDGLMGDGLPLVIVSALCGAGAMVLLARGAPRGTRALAAAAVVAIVWGWGVAQYPYLLPESLRLEDAAAPGGSLTALLVVFLAAAVIVVPAMVLLFTLHQRGTFSDSSTSLPDR
jgi:cytochrome d ubiquinol oxidase subunit II